MAVLYDSIGLNYADLRRPDPRIARRIEAALGPADSVLNLGAGTGSYEPPNPRITAVDPSTTMIAQRAPSDATVIQGRAEHLPFDTNAFDAAMAVLTIHHWSDRVKGIAELRRVTRGKIVILTYDPAFPGFWLSDYFPALKRLDEGQMPRLADFERWLGPVSVSTVAVPHDCSDGFLAGYWRRPRAYLDARVRGVMSSFHALGDISTGLAALERDLESGVWEARYGDLLTLDELDCGYRLIETH